MEASQPRVKPIRASGPEQNLAGQSPLSSPSEVMSLRPLPSVELPARRQKSSSTQFQPKKQSARKFVIFLQRSWMSHQQWRVDEKQQLESQAEWINQRLSASPPQFPRPSYAPQSSSVAPALGVAQPSNPNPLPEDEDYDRLQGQLGIIDEIVTDLGAAIEAGGHLIQKNEPIEPGAIERSEAVQPLAQARARTGAQSPADQEAAQMAETLRQLAEKARSTSAVPSAPDWQPSREFQSQRPQAPHPRRSRRQRRLRRLDLLQLPQRPVDRGVDAVIWIVLAALGRVVVRLLLAVFPALSPLAIGLMAIPAAIGLFLLLFVPKAGYLPVYRLFLITLGLLLGGKL